MSEKYIMVDLDDSRAGIIADAISNKTCKKILNVLSEREMSESEISKELKIPLNTAEYNIKKLVNVGLIEKVNKFFWSSKGKRIHSYRVSNRKILISPKRIIHGFLPTILISGAVALGIRAFYGYEANRTVISAAQEKLMTAASDSALSASSGAGNILSNAFQGAWLWFFIGVIAGLLIYFIWNSLAGKIERRFL